MAIIILVNNKTIEMKERVESEENIIASELDKHIREERKNLETQPNDKLEKGSKTMKKLKIIRQKTVEFVQGKESDKMVCSFLLNLI